MGINSGTTWKEILRGAFPGCWHTGTEAQRRGFDMVVEDLMLRLFMHANRSETRENLVVWWKSHPKWVFDRFPQATQYVGIFDGPAPRAKDPERRDRANTKLCLTPEQIGRLGKAAFLCNPESADLDAFRKEFGDVEAVKSGKHTPFSYFLDLYKHTRSMRSDSINFAQHNLVQMIPRDREIHLDGGVEEGVWKRYSQSCPVLSEAVAPVGEGDIKLVRVMERFPTQNLWISSADTDSIVILLLAMHRELTAQRPVFSRRVYLDMGNMTATKKLNVIDMTAFWRAIMQKAATGGPWHGLKNPVETFCAVLMLSGTDFFKTAPGIGPKTIWKAFETPMGRQILSQSVHIDKAGTLHTAEKRLQAFGRFVYAFVQHSPIQNRKHAILSYKELDEKFNGPMRLRYKKRLEAYHKDMAAVKAGTFKRKRPPKPPRAPWYALDRAKMQVRVRMLGWNLAYWVDAHDRTGDTTLDSREGLSLYGWHRNAENLVAVAPVVFPKL